MTRRQWFQALVIVITVLLLASCSGENHPSGNLSTGGTTGQLPIDAAAGVAGSLGGTAVGLGGSSGVGGLTATGGASSLGGTAVGGAGGGAGGAPRADAAVAGGAVGGGGSGGAAGAGSGGSGGKSTTIGNGCTLSSDCLPGWICATGFCWAPVGGGGAGGAGGVTGSGGKATGGTTGTGGLGGMSGLCLRCGGTGGNTIIGGTTATGGVMGSGGKATGGMTGSGGSGGIAERCSTESGCTLIDDCCNCVIVPAGTPAPASCPGVVCDVDACSQYGVRVTQADVGCWTGFCAVLRAPGDCNASEVECNAIRPTCAAGYLPSVVNRCWGPCVPERGCVSNSTGGAGGGGGSSGTGGMGGSGGSTGTGDYAGVSCGGASCNSGFVCCVSQTVASETCCTASSCPAADLAVACDDPEDCGGAGHQCCMPSGALMQTSCVTGSCLAGLALCHTSSDCPQGQNCCPATLFGYAHRTCQTSSCN